MIRATTAAARGRHSTASADLKTKQVPARESFRRRLEIPGIRVQSRFAPVIGRAPLPALRPLLHQSPPAPHNPWADAPRAAKRAGSVEPAGALA